MSQIAFKIEEKYKKWLQRIADDNDAFSNSTDVLKFMVKYFHKNEELLPQ